MQSFPNGEVRYTTSREITRSHNDFDLGVTEITTESSESPTCHSCKTRNFPPEAFPHSVLSLQGKPGWGGLPRIQRFSTYARRQLLRAGGAAQEVAPHTEFLFLTTTLPGSTRESKEAIARYSGYLVHGLKAWVNKFLPGKLDMYVWELQKRGALHLHYVVHCPDRTVGEYIRTNLQQEWIRLLNSVCRQSGVDLYRKNQSFTHKDDKSVVRVDAQWCELDVSRYLAKYLSKNLENQKRSARWQYYPSRWYGVSRPLLAELAARSQAVEVRWMTTREGLVAHENVLSVLSPSSIACYEYKHKVGTGKTVVAYLDKQIYKEVFSKCMTNINTQPEKSSISRAKLNRVCSNGLLLMRRYGYWENSFGTLSSPHLKGVVSLFKDSKPTTALDMVYLLDTLIYTYNYVQRTTPFTGGSAKLWRQEAQALWESVKALSMSDVEKYYE